ncbi:Cobalt-zinc-cadmium resistance protein CzcA [Leptospirillum ferriphilum]|jgi:Cu/Ag efflux pump CusA|uniref:Cobalt-zinc-cadmium resistance protein CzcA n=1 Tax=Leptospirillum ferriphilum TaxID=178606 RepID=A0A094WEB6_9BACT|nr:MULTISPECIES: efflux RND transporter permease subunit [Leptospirillum]EIJ76203.1 MAG: Putative chemiosmotic efflux system protein A [Leptospirillum sp. Group II 'C75']KGA93977.1 Cobalt-zinc-cadmium resistance protein CzcA [Leptospirillum ferriphilum]
MFNRLIAWSLNNRPIVLAVTLVLFVSGWFALKKMPVDVFPEFAPPQVVVQTEVPGLAPTDVEALVTYPLESAINGTPGVTHVRSKTSVGLSTITVMFKAGSNIYQDRQLVNERIQAVTGRLPSGSKSPILLPVTSAVGWLVKYALTSNTVPPEKLRTLSDWEIRPRLLALGGIASVVSIGGEVKQYQVRLDPARMLAYQVSGEEVRRALERSNSNVPGAFLEKPGQELIVAGIGRISSLDDLRKTVITVRDGVPITISNVAKVAFGGQIKRGDGAFGMKEAVIGTISKTYGADTVTTTEKVEKTLAEIKAHLPAGIQMHTQVFRQANFIEAAIHNLSISLLEGALIVIVVLFIFLMNWRASLITFLSMPASFVGGILTMHALGFGINAMTLGGLAIAIGEVVDNGIITVENVLRRLRLNRDTARPLPPIETVFDAVQEILNSVVYATLIVILIFLPIFFLQGLANRIFSPLGVAYIASVTASLGVAVTMIPALCYQLLVVWGKKEWREGGGTLLPINSREIPSDTTPAGEAPIQEERETRFVQWLKSHYLRLLNLALRKFWWVVGLAVLGLGMALSLLPFFGRSFLPEFHEGNYIIGMTTLPGTSLEESMRLGALVRQDLLKYPQVISIDQRAGRSELDEDAQPPNFSEFDMRLDFTRDPKMPPDVLLKHIRQDLSRVPGAVFNVGQFIAHRMDEVQSGVRAQVAVKIFGDSLSTLYQLGQRVEGVLRGEPGVVDVNVEQQIRVPQLTIRVDRTTAARYGIKAGDLMQNIQMYLNGETVSSVQEGRRSFDLYVRLEHSARNSVETIRDMLVDAPGLDSTHNVKVPLREVASVSLQDEPYSISRENDRRLIIVSFNTQGGDLSGIIRDIQAKIGEQISLPPGYSIEFGGQFESQQQANRTLLVFGTLALFGALILLYKAFGTFREALLVLINLPLAMIGGVMALYLAGADMSVAAVIGFITLFGIATRNGIILISHYNQLRKEGKPLEEVVVSGTLDRLVPVLMTAATASLGLIPILWGSPVGKELERPLAQVVLGGLLTSTFLNMIVIPSVYNRMEQWRERRMYRGWGNSTSGIVPEQDPKCSSGPCA